MADVIVPHLAVPLNFSAGPADLVEQDTLEEVAQCAAAVLATPTGYREEIPDFGTPEQAFSVGGINTQELTEALTVWEPRAEAEIERDDSLLDDLVSLAQVNVSVSEAS